MENSTKGRLLGVVGDVRDETLVKIGAKPSITELIIDSMLDNPVIIAFTIVILAVFGFALIRHFRPSLDGINAFVPAAPGLLTTIGILGTFLGIFVGLLEFDVYEIDQSVPKLLTGLKIAFLTSILGITAALILRAIFAVKPQSAPGENVTPEDIHQLLSDTLDINRDLYHTVRTAGSQITNPRYVSQLESVRETIETGQKSVTTSTESGFSRLTEEFRIFSDRMGSVLDRLERADLHADELERRLDAMDSGVDDEEPSVKN